MMASEDETLSLELPITGLSKAKTLHSDMYHLEKRIATFDNWPKETLVKGFQLAEAGFFYLGIADRVQCVFCDGILRNWDPGDDPWKEHERHFKHCPFIQCKRNGRDLSMSSGVFISGQNARHPDFADFVQRLLTFTSTKWSGQISPENMAYAGFFVLDADITKCYFCGITMREWSENVKPVAVHARLSSRCAYIRELKGNEYVDTMLEIQHKYTEIKIDELMQNEMVKKLTEMGISKKVIRQSIADILKVQDSSIDKQVMMQQITRNTCLLLADNIDSIITAMFQMNNRKVKTVEVGITEIVKKKKTVSFKEIVKLILDKVEWKKEKSELDKNRY